mmetsp:Transcript_42530/g.137407  ORF Transcript_42530/g.137407 Transcript_42530/m.137407 type:complete len:123 (+) Transcript_42530:2-370(+)
MLGSLLFPPINDAYGVPAVMLTQAMICMAGALLSHYCIANDVGDVNAGVIPVTVLEDDLDNDQASEPKVIGRAVEAANVEVEMTTDCFGRAGHDGDDALAEGVSAKAKKKAKNKVEKDKLLS